MDDLRKVRERSTECVISPIQLFIDSLFSSGEEHPLGTPCPSQDYITISLLQYSLSTISQLHSLSLYPGEPLASAHEWMLLHGPEHLIQYSASSNFCWQVGFFFIIVFQDFLIECVTFQWSIPDGFLNYKWNHPHTIDINFILNQLVKKKFSRSHSCEHKQRKKCSRSRCPKNLRYLSFKFVIVLDLAQPIQPYASMPFLFPLGTLQLRVTEWISESDAV